MIKVADIYGNIKYLGSYRAVVVRADDPGEQGRIIVRVPELFDSAESLLALPKFPGMMDVPKPGALTWIEFENGSPELPVYTGIWYSAGGTGNESPKSTRGIPTAVVKGSGRNLVIQDKDGRDIQESPSGFNTVYPYSSVRQNGNGVMFEQDDTPGNERWQVSHPAGSYQEFRRDGSVAFKASGKKQEWVSGDSYEYRLGRTFSLSKGKRKQQILKNDEREVGGVERLTVDRDRIKTIGASEIIEIGSAKIQKVGGNYDLDISGGMIQKVFKDSKLVIGGSEESLVTQSSSKTYVNSFADSNALSKIGIVGNFREMLLAGKFEKVSSLGFDHKTLGTYDIASVVSFSVMTTDSKETAVSKEGNYGSVKFNTLDSTAFYSGTGVELGAIAGALLPTNKEGMVRGDVLVKILNVIFQILQNHIHPTGVGPSGPLLPPDLIAIQNLGLTVGSILSDNVKLVENVPTKTLAQTIVYPLASPAVF